MEKNTNHSTRISYVEDADFKDDMMLHSAKHGYHTITSLIRKSVRTQMKIDNDPNIIFIKTRK